LSLHYYICRQYPPDRNISTQYYERLLLSQVKKASVIKEMKIKTGKFQKNKLEFIKNPSVLEFLGLPGNTGYSEAVIEKVIINHLQQFILELGKGFAFVERQQLVRNATKAIIQLSVYFSARIPMPI
jgi:predicted nuclease of restriction endonuclease-like (RecB) superfamily